ncbi:uncharacterized protein LOC6735904 [Drosophila simulans]|uniref:Uncharacterized protein, isoform B n=1 Tax=Drosophila simulans TaxID=7240 RepID=A0A0J9RKS9_DROSI|nr:uncharacterized protein LOC6735904 [Drosophila simulans]XP_039148370.1 uncharacterized protein LOC6735904 [Drosophila simulans]KMY96064.1 uncharacterized protein Dsimw501_GD25032, isoform B [Drosophila simulans]
MFPVARILGSTSCNRLFQRQGLCRESVCWPSNELHRNLPRHRNFCQGRNIFHPRSNNILNKLPVKRQFTDKFSEKGRGEELNYVLKLASEQFMKIKKNRVKEIANDIVKLKEEIKTLESKTSHKSRKQKENLLKELKALKDLLEQFKKSLEK